MRKCFDQDQIENMDEIQVIFNISSNNFVLIFPAEVGASFIWNHIWYALIIGYDTIYTIFTENECFDQFP